MRGFIVTFSIALSIVCAVIAFSKVNANPNDLDTTTVAKTYVETDKQGRVVSELTMVHEQGMWVEKYKRVISYTNDEVIDITYEFNDGKWKQVSNTVRTYDEESLLSKVTFELQEANSTWLQKESLDFADLSYSPDDMVHDVVYDANGNLLQDAVYEWKDGHKGRGLEMQEFSYNGNGEMTTRTTFQWHGGGWQKETVSDMHYIACRY